MTCLCRHGGEAEVQLRFVGNRVLRRGRVASTTPRALYFQEKPGTHCTVGWVGLETGLDALGKSRPRRSSISGPSSP